MLRKLEAAGIPLPTVYVADTMEDVSVARSSGLPYVVWHGDDRTLLAVLLKPALEKLLPGINWKRFLGISDCERNRLIETAGGLCEAGGGFGPASVRSRIVDIAREGRVFDGGSEKEPDGPSTELDIARLALKEDAVINLDALQHLRLLPSFLGDIRDCVRANLTGGTEWRYGWNKKLGAAVGACDLAPEPNNLLIIDVSGSIPDGISATMLALAETLREQCCADLIVTGSKSYFYPRRSELPSPSEMRGMCGYGNEKTDFMKILESHVAGRRWSNVIAFGDFDAPNIVECDVAFFSEGTRVDRLLSFHTLTADRVAGYAKWCLMLGSEPEVIREDPSWRKIFW